MKDHNLGREHLNGLLKAGTKLHDRVDRMRYEMRQIAGFIPAIQDQMAEFANTHPTLNDNLIEDLWRSHRKHGENQRQHGLGINDISDRLLPSVFARLDDLHGTVQKLTSTVDTLVVAMAAAPSPAVAASAPVAAAPAPNVVQASAPQVADLDDLQAVLVRHLVASGKRAHEADIANAIRNVRARTDAAPAVIPAPETFVYTPAVPTHYAPAAIHAPPPASYSLPRPPPAEPARPLRLSPLVPLRLSPL
ncbi:hypothetical protein K438DRAFT_1939778, partial [Mycena galopus ATCC 62051]